MSDRRLYLDTRRRGPFDARPPRLDPGGVFLVLALSASAAVVIVCAAWLWGAVL